MGADAADAAAASKAIGTANISRQEKKKAAAATARPRKQIVPKKPELAIKTNEGITSEQLQHQQRMKALLKKKKRRREK